MGVQHAQGGEDVGADLGGPVRVQRAFGEERGERAGRDQLADDPERTGLGEHVEDLVEPGVVGYLGGGLRGLDRPPHGGVRTAPDRVPGGASGCRGPAVRVEHLRVHDLRQRHLADQDLLPAVRVESPGLRQFVPVRRRQRKAVAVGEHPTRVVVHVASPERAVPPADDGPTYPSATAGRRAVGPPYRLRTVSGLLRYVATRADGPGRANPARTDVCPLSPDGGPAVSRWARTYRTPCRGASCTPRRPTRRPCS